MARCVLMLLLPILLSLFLLGDATRNNLLATRKEETNKEVNSVILVDAFEPKSLPRLPRDSEKEVMMDVPQLVRSPWRSARASTETENRFRERKGERKSVFIGGERSRELRLCHHHDGGGKLKFGHFPMLPREDPSSFRIIPAESLSQTESREILGLEAREKAFRCIGKTKGFSERKHSLDDTLLCLLSIMKEDREIKQQKRQLGQAAPWVETQSVAATRTVSVPTTTAYPSKEVVSVDTRPSFTSEEEEKHGRLHEDPAAPWTDWLRSLFLHH